MLLVTSPHKLYPGYFWRAPLAGRSVTDVTHGPHRLAHYLAQGTAIDATTAAVRESCEKDARWKSPKTGLSHLAWKSRQRRGIPTLPQLRRLRVINLSPTFHVE